MTKLNKIFIGIAGVIVAISFILGVFGFMRGVQESSNGATPNVVEKEERLPDDLAEHILSKEDLIVVHDPEPLAGIDSPLTVRGEARGTWYFEASFPITLVDWDGRIIAQSFATAQDDPQDGSADGAGWMTEDFVPFEGTIEFENPSFPGADEDHFSRRGTIIFQKDNPSGLPEHDDALEIPVWFDRK